MLSALLLSTALFAQLPPFPGQIQTINIVQWDANDLPKVYQRSDQQPLTSDELVQLTKAGFETAQIVKMLEERRCACDASAAGLIALKTAGATKEVLAAVSTHALPPNRSFVLEVTLDFIGEGTHAREGVLYFFLDDGELTRVFTANLAELLGRQNAHEAMVDGSDPLLKKKVRRIKLASEVPLKTYGKHTVLVVSSANPSLRHPTELTEKERKTAQTFTFDYPRASVQRACRLEASYKRDVALADRWRFAGSRFQCEWN